MRSCLLILVLLFAAEQLVLGQSKKEVLKKAIEAYKLNPSPAFKGHYFHISPLLSDSSIADYYHGFIADKEKLTKYYSSTSYKAKITLDSTYSYWNEGEYPYQAARTKTPKELYSQIVNMEMPPACRVPLNKLGEFYFRKKKALMKDTLIEGETCYRFELKIKDSFDPITGMKITDGAETITISWQTGFIREYAFQEKWDGDIYKMYYSFQYLTDSNWQVISRKIDLDFSSKFANYVPTFTTSNTRSQLLVGDTIQFWSFRELSGDSIDIRTLDRDYYVLDFWYTSCGPCVGAIPNNNKLDSAIQQYNAQVLGITTFHKSDVFLENFIKKRSIQYKLFTYPDNSIETYFPIRVYPTYVVIDKRGRIIHISEGAYRLNYKQEIEDLIKAEAGK